MGICSNCGKHTVVSKINSKILCSTCAAEHLYKELTGR